MSRIFRILTAMIIVITVGISLSYAETIWEKRQKALQQGAAGTKASAPETAVEEKQRVPGAYSEEAEQALRLQAEEAAQGAAATVSAAQGAIDPYSITILEQYGTIIESYKGTNGNLIVHIQDAHANYEAQKNIAGIFESLINNYGINLVLMEGKVTDKDFKYLRYKASLDARKEIADGFLKEGLFNGVNYLDLASDYPIVIQGIEDKTLYDINGIALWGMDKFKDAALEYVSKMTAAADTLKPKIYNEGLSTIDQAKKAYDNEEIDLLEYYEDLYKAAKDKNVQLDKFPNFSNVIKINEMEKKIDLAKINDDTATEEQKSVYKEYKDLLANLNINKLFKEEPLVEAAIQNSLFENNDQKELFKISKALSTIDKMLKVKIVPEEYSYFSENKPDFDSENWANFLKEKSGELGVTLNIPYNSSIISDNIASIQKFYSSALDREEVFIRKSKARMEKDDTKSAILIAGGFHTPTLTKLLSDNGYSYIVISPKVTTKTDDNLYRQTLKRQWAPGIE